MAATKAPARRKRQPRVQSLHTPNVDEAEVDRRIRRREIVDAAAACVEAECEARERWAKLSMLVTTSDPATLSPSDTTASEFRALIFKAMAERHGANDAHLESFGPYLLATTPDEYFRDWLATRVPGVTALDEAMLFQWVLAARLRPAPPGFQRTDIATAIQVERGVSGSKAATTPGARRSFQRKGLTVKRLRNPVREGILATLERLDKSLARYRRVAELWRRLGWTALPLVPDFIRDHDRLARERPARDSGEATKPASAHVELAEADRDRLLRTLPAELSALIAKHTLDELNALLVLVELQKLLPDQVQAITAGALARAPRQT